MQSSPLETVCRPGTGRAWEETGPDCVMHVDWPSLLKVENWVDCNCVSRSGRDISVTDIQKFFNGLPRAQLATLMLDFGFPEPLVRQWFILLSQLKRSVIVQGDYSFPQRSVCGVPEGDPVSVAAAVVVGAQLLHVIQQRTQALLLVYIDNVELISRDETQICQATDLTLDFFAQWGLKIDLAKSWAWSTVPTRKICEKNDHFSDFWDTVHSSDGNPKKAFAQPVS